MVSRTELMITTQSQLLMTLGKKPFENIVGKGENAGNSPQRMFGKKVIQTDQRKKPIKFDLINCVKLTK